MFTQASLKPLAEKLAFLSKLSETEYPGLEPVLVQVKETGTTVELKLGRDKSPKGQSLRFTAEFVVFNSVSQLGACGHCVHSAQREAVKAGTTKFLPETYDKVNDSFAVETKGAVIQVGGAVHFTFWSPYRRDDDGCADRETTLCPVCGEKSALLNLKLVAYVKRPEGSPLAKVVSEFKNVDHFSNLAERWLFGFFQGAKQRAMDLKKQRGEEAAAEFSKRAARWQIQNDFGSYVTDTPQYQKLLEEKQRIQAEIDELWHEGAKTYDLPEGLRREDLVAEVETCRGRSFRPVRREFA